MEYIIGTRVSNEEVDDCKQFLMESVLPKLSERKYVHGDLRMCFANIIKSNEIYGVRYDLSGKEGEVRFPLDLNTRLSWPVEVIPGGCITANTDYKT